MALAIVSTIQERNTSKLILKSLTRPVKFRGATCSSSPILQKKAEMTRSARSRVIRSAPT